MRFLVAFLLITTANVTLSRDEDSKAVGKPEPTAQDLKEKTNVEGGKDQVEGQEEATTATQEKGKEVAQPQKDIIQDYDWETRDVKAIPRETTCTGGINQAHLLTLQDGILKETKRKIGYTMQCKVDVKIISDEGNQLALFSLINKITCTLEKCTVENNGVNPLKHVTSGAMTLGNKGVYIKTKVSTLLKEQLVGLKTTTDAMINAAKIKHIALMGEMSKDQQTISSFETRVPSSAKPKEEETTFGNGEVGNTQT